MAKEKLFEEIEVPEGIKVEITPNRGILIAKGDKSIERGVPIGLSLNIKGTKIRVSAERARRKERMMFGTLKAHIKNVCKGLEENHVYKLKICSGHFPMNVSLSGKEFVVKNFLGENVPRRLAIRDGVNIKISGTEVIVESKSKELAGQTAANIEKLTKIKGRDLRIFQDGIWLISKDGKSV